MSILSAFCRLLGTASWRREEARLFAHERFHAFDYRSAAAVLECLVEMLGITFEQLHPHTQLAADLGADEDEPQWISTWFQEELGISISPQQVADSQTVGGLVKLVTRTIKQNDA